MDSDIAAPDGWVVIESAGPYTKIVKRDAVHVPRRATGEGFHRDAVIVVTEHIAGVTKGPGARQSWQVDDPAAAGVALAETIDEWIAEGGDPYGGSELNERLEEVVTDVAEAATEMVEVW